MLFLHKQHEHITMHLISLEKHPLQLGLQDQQVGRSAPPKTESCRLAQWPKSPKWQENHHGNRSNNDQIIQNCTEQYRITFFIWGALEIWWDLLSHVQTQESIRDLIRKDMVTPPKSACCGCSMICQAASPQIGLGPVGANIATVISAAKVSQLEKWKLAVAAATA